MPPRLSRLLASLSEHNVRFVLIGAAAFPAHGFSRVTDDVDFLFEPTADNIARLRAVLRAFGYPEWDVTEDEFRAKKLLFRGFEPEIDLHPTVKGAAWEDVWTRRVLVPIEGVTVPCASLEHLIDMKRAAGRPGDLEDLKALEEVKRQQDDRRAQESQ